MSEIDFSHWGTAAVAAVAVVLAALVVHAAGRPVLRRLAAFSPLPAALLRRGDRPARAVLPLLALQVLWQAAPDTLAGIAGVRHATAVLLILALTWLATSAVSAVADAVLERHPVEVADNLQARRIATQTRVLSRTVIGLVVFAGIAFVLMTFPGARRLGTSLLASAGVAGLVIGLAAQSVVGNLLAGLQIALAQPIRIDDVLIVEGEWGRVEEITATYVVIRLWDERRLVVPLKWFIEKPFQNWTRSSSSLIGTVYLWVDYTLPLQPLREEAQRVCEASPAWDGRLCKLQVTDSNERAMQVRVLVSAASSGDAWELRCTVREALIDFVQREHPGSLPRLRAGPDGVPAA